ncbi:hypothetical protein ACHAWF_006965 [Thalassiosira exigua]
MVLDPSVLFAIRRGLLESLSELGCYSFIPLVVGLICGSVCSLTWEFDNVVAVGATYPVILWASGLIVAVWCRLDFKEEAGGRVQQ